MLEHQGASGLVPLEVQVLANCSISLVATPARGYYSVEVQPLDEQGSCIFFHGVTGEVVNIAQSRILVTSPGHHMMSSGVE